jgi:hypothetical protein
MGLLTQPKEHIDNEVYHVVTTTNVCKENVARRLERNRVYDVLLKGMGSVVARERCGG